MPVLLEPQVLGPQVVVMGADLTVLTDRGGEALANTAWSVLTPGGDVIKESIGAFPRVILAEGEYRAIARSEGKVYEREFKVVTGVDGDVEVLAR